MDPLGNVIRDLLKRKHAENVRNARCLAISLKTEGMTADQIEEMLHASEFDPDVIAEAMTNLPQKKGK